jgi:hypothetical protein
MLHSTPAQNYNSLAAHRPISFSQIIDVSTALASISHVPTSWQPKLPDFKMASCETLSNSLLSLAKTLPKSEIKNQKFKIQVFLQVFNHRGEKK